MTALACGAPPARGGAPGSAGGPGPGTTAGGAGVGEAAVEPLPPEAAAAEVAALRQRGPVFTPYDRAPRILWDADTELLLSEKLLPVLEAHDLPAWTRSRYWLLVGADGQVHDVVLHSGMANAAFHRAGAEVGAAFRYQPAVRDGRPTSVWFLQEISLVMR